MITPQYPRSAPRGHVVQIGCAAWRLVAISGLFRGVMAKFDEITERFGDVPFMNAAQAARMRELIAADDAKHLLEIGTFHGKGTAYLAAILEDRGAGHLVTIDKTNAQTRTPNVIELLAAAGLSHRATPRFAYRSYTWELQGMLAARPRPVFDLCYFDGSHLWDSTGLGVMLVEMLLKPGGILVLDDMDWSIDRSPAYQARPDLAQPFSPDERAAKPVRLVWELIMPRLGFEPVEEVRPFGWGVARKPYRRSPVKLRQIDRGKAG